MRINRTFLRFFAYSLLIIILYEVQGTPNFMPEIFGSKPLLLTPFALAVSANENKIPSLIFGAVCGIFTDIGSGYPIGFFAVFLTLACYFEVHIFEKFFVPSFFTVMVYSLLVNSCIICIFFLFFKVFAGIEDCGTLFVCHYISRIVYTVIMTVPFYFICNFVYDNLNDSHSF